MALHVNPGGIPANLERNPASLQSASPSNLLPICFTPVKGVVGLAKGLGKAKTAYPLVVAVLPDVPEEHSRMLVEQGCIVREIDPVYPPKNQTQFAMAYHVINYSKLRILEEITPMRKLSVKSTS